MSQFESWFHDKYEEKNGRTLSIKVDRILCRIHSPFQEICVVDTPAFGKMLVNDGIIMLSENDESAYHEMISHVPLCVHPLPRDVLVIGGGDGGTVRELVKHFQVSSIDVCEIDQKVVAICRKYFPKMTHGFDDPRTKIYNQDGAEFLKNRENQYDIIIVDSSDPIGPGVTLFSKVFYQSLYRSLKPNGIAVTQMESLFWHAHFIREKFKFIQSIFPIVSYYYTMVPTYPSGMIGFSFCSRKYHPIDDFNPEVAQQLKNLNYYHTHIHQAAFVLPLFAQKIFS